LARGATCCYQLAQSSLLKKGTESEVAQVSSWGNPVPHELLEVFHLWESPCFLSGPDDLVVNSDLEDAAFAGDKSQLAGFVLKSREEFLSHPAGPRKPTASDAVGDFNSVSHN
jgi:hypothetical protein